MSLSQLGVQGKPAEGVCGAADGWKRIWLTTGTIRADLRRTLRSSTSKLDTPIDLTRPSDSEGINEKRAQHSQLAQQY